MSSRWCWKRPTSRERGPRGIRGAESMSRSTRHRQQTSVEARTRLRDARVDPSRGRSGAAKPARASEGALRSGSRARQRSRVRSWSAAAEHIARGARVRSESVTLGRF